MGLPARGDVGARRSLRLDLGRERERGARRQVAHPEEREGERDDRAEAGDLPRDDEPDQEHDDAHGEADRPEARARDMRMVFVGCKG